MSNWHGCRKVQGTQGTLARFTARWPAVTMTRTCCGVRGFLKRFGRAAAAAFGVVDSILCSRHSARPRTARVGLRLHSRSCPRLCAGQRTGEKAVTSSGGDAVGKAARAPSHAHLCYACSVPPVRCDPSRSLTEQISQR